MAKRGLGSDNMSEDKKRQIQSEGGQASHGGGRQSEQSEQEGGSEAYYSEITRGGTEEGEGYEGGLGTSQGETGMLEDEDLGGDLTGTTGTTDDK